MNFSEKLTECKDILTEKTADLKDWVLENKKISILILSLLVVILLCIVLLISLSPKKEKKVIENPLVLSSELVVPKGPANPDSFKLSRTTEDKWDSEQLEPYFTKPSGREIEDLEKANDKLIKNILEAAP